MDQDIKQNALPQRLSDALDWAVLGAGVLSLSFAIGATIVTKTTVFAADDGAQTAAPAAG